MLSPFERTFSGANAPGRMRIIGFSPADTISGPLFVGRLEYPRHYVYSAIRVAPEPSHGLTTLHAANGSLDCVADGVALQRLPRSSAGGRCGQGCGGSERGAQRDPEVRIS